MTYRHHLGKVAWQRVAAHLDTRGVAVIQGVLTQKECAALTGLYWRATYGALSACSAHGQPLARAHGRCNVNPLQKAPQCAAPL